MPDWQERVTRESAPQIRLEHLIRYAAAVPLLTGGGSWCDLGCGSGLAAEDAFGATRPARALLVDVDAEAAEEAAARFADGDAVPLALDLSREDGVDAVRRTLDDRPGTCITCFETIEHLESFVPLVKLLVERAGAGDTILLSVPNDALTGVQNPFHLASWGEAALAELRTMLPPDHVVLEQLSLVGSVLHGRDEPPRKERVEVALEPVAGVSHLLLTFGARAGEVAQPCRVEVVDVDEQRHGSASARPTLRSRPPACRRSSKISPPEALPGDSESRFRRPRHPPLGGRRGSRRARAQAA